MQPGSLLGCLALVLTAVLNCCQTDSVNISNWEFPSEFCTNGRLISLGRFLLKSTRVPENGRKVPLRVIVRLIRFGDDICRLHKLWTSNNSVDEPLSAFAQSADMREFCLLASPPVKRRPNYWSHERPISQCMTSIRDNRRNMASKHLEIYRFQASVLLLLMCLCCYVYGRIFSLKISPIARLRRLNWTTENFIWAYKNF